MLEHKTFPITQAQFKADTDVGPGTFEGIGAAFGNIDKGGDVIVKGAFADVLPTFLERGFVSVGHDFIGLPEATITDAKETDEGLWFSAQFHSHQAAQDARTVLTERIARGKFVGLSIGWLPDYSPEGMEIRDDGVRVIKRVAELPEMAITLVPMNVLAEVRDAKSGLGTDLPYAEHGDWVRDAITQFVTHTKFRHDLRMKEGRVLSAANRSRLSDIAAALRTGAADLDGILSETDPERDKAEKALARARMRWLLDDVDMLLAEAR